MFKTFLFAHLQGKRVVIADPDSSSEDVEQEEEQLAKQLESDSDEATSEGEILPDSTVITSSSLNVSDYVLAAVHGKRSTKHYVAMVISKESDEIEVDFLLQLGNQYVRPDERDTGVVHVSDIILILPPPSVCGGTKRTSVKLTFPVDLSEYQ